MDILDLMFDDFKKVAKRIESLPQYKIYDTKEYEEFQKYNNKEEIIGYANSDWLKDLENWYSQGKEIFRIRVVPKNITPYYKYEVDFCYPKNKASNEQIRFINEDDYNYLIDKYNVYGDFWIFDEEHVISLEYDKEGEYVDCYSINDDKKKKQILKLYNEMEKKSY